MCGEKLAVTSFARWQVLVLVVSKEECPVRPSIHTYEGRVQFLLTVHHGQVLG